jgi:hypothetical protein
LTGSSERVGLSIGEPANGTKMKLQRLTMSAKDTI